MRGEDQRSEVLFSYVRLESRIPADHPLRAIRTLIDEALKGLSRDFNKLYARDGRPSIPPERLLRALLLQAFYTVRSERQLVREIEVNVAYRDTLEAAGLRFSGNSPDGLLPEIIEIPEHPWFIGVQFHPELKSRPLEPHPLFTSFIAAAVKQGRLV